MQVKCVVCGDDLRLRPLEDCCPYCGRGPEEEDWFDKYGSVRCAEYVSPDGPYVYLGRGRAHRIMCRACAESFSFCSDALILVDPSLGRFIFHYRNGVLEDIDGCCGERLPFRELPRRHRCLIRRIVNGTVWRRTDAWRGYSQPPSAADGWVLVIDGWHSSVEASEFSEKLNRILAGHEPAPCPLAVVVGRTSNVFALGVSVFAPVKKAHLVRRLADHPTGGVGGIVVL